MQLLRELSMFGFSRPEAALWKASLELGESDLTTLAKRAGIPRTSAYAAIEKLRAGGLLDFYMKRRRRIYVAVPPERFVQGLATKAETANRLLPALRSLTRKKGNQPQITLHEGMTGVRAVFDHLLEYQHHFSAITSLEDMQAVASRPFSSFIRQRIRQNLRVRFITNRSSEAEALAKRDHEELRETRFVPESYEFHTANYVFGHHVAFLSLRNERPLAVLIHDDDIAATFQLYFDLLWDQVAHPLATLNGPAP